MTAIHFGRIYQIKGATQEELQARVRRLVDEKAREGEEVVPNGREYPEGGDWFTHAHSDKDDDALSILRAMSNTAPAFERGERMSVRKPVSPVVLHLHDPSQDGLFERYMAALENRVFIDSD